MNRDALRALQTPLKERYREEPGAAMITLRAEGRLGEGVSCWIRVRAELEGELTGDERRQLLELTERYCVVYQTLRGGCEVGLIDAREEART